MLLQGFLRSLKPCFLLWHLTPKLRASAFLCHVGGALFSVAWDHLDTHFQGSGVRLISVVDATGDERPPGKLNATVIDNRGRTRFGHTIEVFCVSVKQTETLAFGIRR